MWKVLSVPLIVCVRWSKVAGKYPKEKSKVAEKPKAEAKI